MKFFLLLTGLLKMFCYCFLICNRTFYLLKFWSPFNFGTGVDEN